MRKIFYIPITLLILLFSCVDLSAEVIAEKLVKKEYHRDTGKDSHAKLKMILKDSRGRARERDFETYVLFNNDLRKQLIKFTSPKNIEGTSFLSWENSSGDDDQFLYLPAARRVRRVVTGQKGKAFVNSDYSYEDMQRRHYSRDKVERKDIKKYLGYECTVVRRTPKNQDDSQYAFVDSCIANNLSVSLKAWYFDKKGEPIKEFTAKEIKNIEGIWTITKSEFKNLEEESSTELIVDKINYNSGVSDKIFTKTYLKNTM